MRGARALESISLMKAKKSKTKNGATKRVSLFGMPVDIGIDANDVLERVVSGRFLLSYLNPYAYSIANTHEGYLTHLEKFDLVVCDGIGVQVAIEAVFNQTTPIISLDYSGIGHDYLQAGSDRGNSLCLVGGKNDIVETAADKLRRRYPGFKEINAFSGYGKSPEHAREFIQREKPEMVLVGLGMGRQEAYLVELVDGGWNGVGICVGGFFDKLAKPQLNYPKWSEKTRIRFLGRLVREPRRLSRRYFIDYQPFIKKYLKYKLSRH